MQSIRYISFVLEYLSKSPPAGGGGGGVTGILGPLRRKFSTQALDGHCYHFKVGHECFLVSCSSPYRLVAHFCLWTKAPTWGLGLTKHNDLHTNCPSKAQLLCLVMWRPSRMTLQTYRRCVILYHRLSQGSCKIIILWTMMCLMGCPKNIDFYKKVQKFSYSYTLTFFKNSIHINFSKKLLMKKNMPVK